MKKILIVGFGSIGSRHLKNFKSLGCSVSIVSRRTLEVTEPVFPNLEVALKQSSPDLVFICTETVDHQMSLDVLVTFGFKGVVVVEKPLFHTSGINFKKYKSLNVKVAYHMRFNPLILKLKNDLQNVQGISSAVAYVGQYLPTWRPQSDFRKNYSAFKEKGGGVLLDLSHELDYCHFLFGDFQKAVGLVQKNSSLEINSDDSVAIQTVSARCPQLSVLLNYTDRITQRFLICNTDEFTVKIDFIAKTYQKNAETINFSTSWEDPYLKMAENILNLGANQLTSFSEGFQLNRMIDQLRLSSSDMKWVQL